MFKVVNVEGKDFLTACLVTIAIHQCHCVNAVMSALGNVHVDPVLITNIHI